MPLEIHKTGLLDFGVGLLAAMVLADMFTLDERRLIDTHKAVVKAFEVVEAHLGEERLSFWMTTNRFHGTSADVDTIFGYWLKTGYVTKDSPGTIYRFHMGKDTAKKLLKTLPGGTELYAQAVFTFTEYLDTL